MKEKDSQSRKWQITINNPLDHEYSREVIKEKFNKFKSLVYWCMSDEIGETGTPHTHIFMAFKGAVRFSTLKKHFEVGHFEVAKGTSQQNRDYAFKEGKWEDDKKQDTNLKDTHEEWGEMPVESPGKRNDLEELYKMVESGMSNADILKIAPQHMTRTESMDKVRQIILNDTIGNNWRDVEVTYIFGESGTGKTRGLAEKYGYDGMCRVTNYDHPFDFYENEDVLVLDEFRSSLKLTDMLNYLDGHKCVLPCRYSDKIATYTKVYILSNWSLEDQYINIQESKELKDIRSWNGFIRRIDNVVEYTGTEIIKKRTADYLNKARDFVEVEADPKVRQMFTD